MPSTATPGTPSSPDPADSEFYRKALASGVSEVAASELAANKAASDEIRQLAARLAQDHRALNEWLRQSSGTQDDPAPPPENKAAEDHLRGLQGEAFDRAWLEHMAQGHAKSIALYEATARGGRSEQARTLAAGALPQLREHAASIDRLRNAGDDTEEAANRNADTADNQPAR